MGRFGRPSTIQRLAVKAVGVEEPVESRQADTNVPRCFDEIEYVVARGIGMSDQEIGNGTCIARQEFPVRTPGKSVLNLTDDLP